MRTLKVLTSPDRLLLFFFLVFFFAPVYAHADGDIQTMIDRAEPGEVVTIPRGTYEEVATIDKPLVLLGEGVQWSGESGETLVTIKSNHVKLSGFTFIQGDDRLVEAHRPGLEIQPVDSNPVIRVEESDAFTFENNVVNAIGTGVYGKGNESFTIENNSFRGVYSSYMDRGLAAVELYETNHVKISANKVRNVLDGFYLDSLSHAEITGNTVENSRYATHLMFSSDIEGEANRYEGNVNGLMIMDTEDAVFHDNQLIDQFHVNGYGVLMYRSERIELYDNEISRNITGIKLEETAGVSIHNNAVTGNQIGLGWERQEEDFKFHSNQMVSNVLSTKGESGSNLSLSSEGKGNYWGDYDLIDEDGDGIGEEPYVAGSIYDDMLTSHPEWQLFLNSPAMTLWSQVQKWMPSSDDNPVVDSYPETQNRLEKDEPVSSDVGYLVIGIVLLLTSGVSLYHYRKENA